MKKERKKERKKKKNQEDESGVGLTLFLKASQYCPLFHLSGIKTSRSADVASERHRLEQHAGGPFHPWRGEREVMESQRWKNHIRAVLLQRDKTQREPYAGAFARLSELEEQVEMRTCILNEDQTSAEGGESDVRSRLLYLQLRESERLAEKLSQTVSDLTHVLHLKEPELQYLQSQVSRYRQEALTLAKGSKALKTVLADCEFTIESQSKELAALRLEQRELREDLANARAEKEALLQRWMEEKREVAKRVNKYNNAQERWRRLARRLTEIRKYSGLSTANSELYNGNIFTIRQIEEQ
ncbi:autophagy-related protein 16-1 [Lampris incognitus]|uniref:autophagy-related protein 16-1 n=1 Tax=Lampris incognitus TaxID=2546036 RepID=UPI0024B4D4BE|nr:autophagy-related protein 16-1 [Lampris incognitus]